MFAPFKNTTYKTGAAAPLWLHLKKTLIVSGDLFKIDTTTAFTAEVTEAVKRAQSVLV